MRGDVLFAILENLVQSAEGMADFFVVMAQTKYGASARELSYRIASKHHLSSSKNRKDMQAFYNIVHYLEKDGLITKEGKRGKKVLKITLLGVKRYDKIKEKREGALFPDVGSYHSEKRKRGVVIVVFDIPEKDRRKRDWLRYALRELGFTLVQRSVWMGKTILPREFISDLRALGLDKFVEIFQVSAAGSLRHLL